MSILFIPAFDDKKNRFIVEYGIGDYDAEVLTSEKNTANFFEQVSTKSFRIVSR